MKYIIRVKVFDETESKVISNRSFTTNDKEFAESYTELFPKFNPHSFVLKTDYGNFWDEIKSWYEWNFILKK